ncbi:MAG: pyridoxal-phosphate-dependent aminotransferase [Candidatus Jorgensenbacteria bacterium GW2011_GWC1_48_8]|uniref:Pyridoxal-phosphate-dependent aminotransferase n=1 Tax=Candidatus Jorgensenbacteria bacterium GW2011_GWC1_48_8 TaxID=1618666 RepID=A0A0G1UUZ0_9BACT|nr:MAG: pyridoxal-phosphate-dependent aminotransferase [Parcubacteria group bacterium GW2011_GWB1_45_10]KKU98049.1 MAG: pyridoxal-phosphate-dependent aminotransferase [Candidatus Jorgensenbacteria bacterium GW2011_GWC1_48_8]
MYKVRFVNPQKQYADHRDELLGAMDEVLKRGALVTPKDLAVFEEKFAELCEARYGIATNSGTSALDIALQAAGVGPGDEVITVAHTFIASISTICMTGAKAVLVDVGRDFNMDASKIEEAISPQTKAIMPVHFNGRLCDMEAVMEIAKRKGLIVIEDAAQALGATMKMADGTVKKAGTFGLVGCFSLYWAKALGGPGTAGIAVTDDAEVARKLRLMRYNGEDREDRHFYYHAHNFLLDNIKAAFLLVKMKYFPEWLRRRKEIAEMYRKGLENVKGVKQLPHFDDDRRSDIYNNYVILVERRDELKKYLDDNQSAETLVQYATPNYEEPVMKETKGKLWRFGNLNATSLPVTEEICKDVISLPMYPELTNEQVDYVIETIKNFYK